ncbi:MAG: hypothetical protein C4331_13270 [Meiothermus sp.]
MKKRTVPLLLVGLIVALTGCVVVSGGFRIISASATTNFQSSSGENFVCDNKQTVISYTFTYSNDSTFLGWDSFLRGVASGDVKGFVSFNAGDPGNNQATNTVAVDYIVQPGAVPLGRPMSRPQAIVVVPNPSVVGRTYVVVRARSAVGNKEFAIGPFRVVDNCP